VPGASFFRKLGLYVAEDFLDPSQCARLCQELMTTQSAAATILGDGTKPVVDEGVRKVARAGLTGPPEEELRKRLLDLMPALGAQFQEALTGCQGPEFLRYRVGSFYKVHHDGGPAHSVAAGRRVSVIIFLNHQSKELAEGAYGGGSLVFYGLLRGEEWQNVGLPLDARQGMLVAFRSGILHEVQPVTHGERLTVVSWFTSNEQIGGDETVRG